MVKGTTRQVIWVKGTDEKLFEQAIFLVRDEALRKGGVSEEALLKEAKAACAGKNIPLSNLGRAVWAGCGAAGTGVLWLLTSLLLP